MAYVTAKKNDKGSEDGIKSCFFITSHLSYAFPHEVSKSGIVEVAVETIQSFEVVPVASLQTIEGACRLLDTIAANQETRTSMPGKGAIEALLYSLAVKGIEDGNIQTTLTNDAEGPPRDAFKMRAASALNHLAGTIPQAEKAVATYLSELESSTGKVESQLVWLSVHPVLRRMILERPALMRRLEADLQTSPSYDLCILILATRSSLSTLQEYVYQKLPSGTRFMDFLLDGLWSGRGHAMCARWVTLADSLRGAAEQLAAGELRLEDDAFFPTLLGYLVSWIQTGHPYKAASTKLLLSLCTDERLGRLAVEKVLVKPNLLKPETKLMLQQERSFSVLSEALKAAFKELETQ